jgi:hypothetical protein
MQKSVDAARAVVAELQTKLDELDTRKLALQAQRDEIAFDALASDEPKAKAQLSKVSKLLIECDHEMGALGGAIAEAERRVVDASASERQAAERQRAEEALGLGRQMADAGKAADLALSQAFAALNEMQHIAHELARLGCPPSPGLVSVNIRRAIATASQGSPFVLATVAPGDRRSIGELSAGWAAGITNWSEKRLPQAEAA